MPQIKEYENPITGIHPTDLGVEATAQAARRGSQIFKETAGAEQRLANETRGYGQQVEQAGRLEGHMYEGAIGAAATGLKDAGDAAVDYMTNHQISHGAVAYTGLLDNVTKQWNDVSQNTDANDTTVQRKFMNDTLEPAIDKFKSAFWTEGSQKWAEERADALRNHMFEKTTQDMGTRAYVAAKANHEAAYNNMTNTVMADPTALPHLLDTVDTTIAAQIASSPNLRGANAAQFQTEMSLHDKEGLVKSATYSAIQSSGDPVGTAAKYAKMYPDYINGLEAKTFAKAAETQVKMNTAQVKAAAASQKAIDSANFDQKHSQFLQSFLNPDGTIRPATADDFKTVKSLAMMPGAKASSVQSLIGFASKEAKVQNSDPAVLEGLRNDIIANKPGVLTDLANANIKKDLSDKDFSHLKTLRQNLDVAPINERGFNIALQAVKSEMLIPDNYSEFFNDFTAQYVKLSPQDRVKAMNKNDPTSLISQTISAHDPSPGAKTQYRIEHPLGIMSAPDVTPPEKK